MKRVNVAIIGFGHLGRWHAQKAAQLEQANLVAIVEPFELNQKTAKEMHPDVKIVKSVEEVIDEIDAAIIVTPTSTHYELTKKLLLKSKHVFCEKPLCSTYDEALDLEKYLEKNILQVGHSERCHAPWESLKSDISKIQGKRTIKMNRFAPFKGRATDVDVVQDLMIHDIDLMLYLFSTKPCELTAIGHKIRTDKWDHVSCHFFLENGDEVFITSGRNHVKEVRELEVMSEKGCHYVDLYNNTFSYGTCGEFEDSTYVKTQPYEKRDHLLIEQESFYNSVLNQTKPMVDYKDGLNAVYLVSKVHEALNNSQRLLF